MDYSEIITIVPGRRSGKACVRDTRITVYDVLEYMAAGMSQEELLADFPDLTAPDIRLVLPLLPTLNAALRLLPFEAALRRDRFMGFYGMAEQRAEKAENLGC